MAQINASKDAQREVFQTSRNVIEYRTKDPIVVQKGERDFTISIIATDGITELPLFWRFLCENYQKKGTLTIKVEPSIEDIKKTVEVESIADIKPDEVKVVAKVIEG